MRVMGFLTAPFTKGAALGAAAALGAVTMGAAPAHAQFEIIYPSTPVEEGQTLIDWADPPVLKHTIPQAERSNESDCALSSEFDLNTAALTCWKILLPYQWFVRANFASGEPTGDSAQNQRRAIEYADEAIAFIGQPQWPLQEYLLTKSLEVKLDAQRKLSAWEDASHTSALLVSALQGDLMRFDEFRLAYAYRKQSGVLIELGRIEDARTILENARALLGEFDGEKIALPFSNHSEDLIVQAINAGDFDYAETTAHAYLTHVRTAPRGMAFGHDEHIDLLLYSVARRGDRDTALSLIEERFAKQRDYRRCHRGAFQFPKVLGPLIEGKDIRAALVKGGCPADRMVPPDGKRIKGFGDTSLPPFARAGN